MPSLTNFNGLALTGPPEAEGVLAVLEAPRSAPRKPAAFVADLAGQGRSLSAAAPLNIHGSYLVTRPDHLLFGPNHLVSRQGHWSCEARAHKQQFLEYMQADFYQSMYPGPRPRIDLTGQRPRLYTSHLQPDDVTFIDNAVFLATPLEPPVWGRWITSVLPKLRHYQAYGAGRDFFCYAALDWQRQFLRLFGLPDAQLRNHDPGRSYICRDLMTVEFSETNFTISTAERDAALALADHYRHKIPTPPNLFISRLTRSARNPGYRALQNEAELASALEPFGFAVIEPETFQLQVQIALFANAKNIVCLGGSAIFNTAFCGPDTKVISLESSKAYAPDHARFFASLGLDYGIIFGAEDDADPSPQHRRWHINTERAVGVVRRFMAL